ANSMQTSSLRPPTARCTRERRWVEIECSERAESRLLFLRRLRFRTLCLSLLMLTSATLVAHPGSGIVVDQRGTVYFIDTGGGVWRIEPSGVVAKHGGPKFHWLALDARGVFAHGRLPSIPSAEIATVGANPVLLASSDFPIAVGQDGALYYPELGA